MGIVFLLVPFMKTFNQQQIVIDTIFGQYTPEEISMLTVILTFWSIMLTTLFILAGIINCFFSSIIRAEIRADSNGSNIST
jgi:hypothetical protein